MPADLQAGSADTGKAIIAAFFRPQCEAGEIPGSKSRCAVKPADNFADRFDRQMYKWCQRAEPGSRAKNRHPSVIITSSRVNRDTALAGGDVLYRGVR
ncbi:hypothetical protein D3C75_1247950 [compost metagenome]